MYAVAIVKMPSQNRFLGTFDVESWTNWWMSDPLPDTVAEILMNQAVYAQYHVCLCKLTDGRYAIFQSPDYGQTWRLVYTTWDTIYALYTIDPGRVLGATSAGWIESQNSGTDWTYVSFQAPGARHVISVGNDVLFAHDGERVWRSIDMARTWKIVLNCRYFQYLYSYGSGSDFLNYTGNLYPRAMDGVYFQVAVGIGNKIFVSEDLGDHWYLPNSFYFPGQAISGIYPESSRKLLQILHTGCSGNLPDDNTWMFRMWHTDSNIVRHYMVKKGTSYIGDGHVWFDPTGIIARFDQPFYSEYEGMLSSYEVTRVGSMYKDKVVFSAQKVLNTATGAYEPSLKYSINGGLDWIDINLSAITVYDGQTGTPIVGAFTEDSEASYSWIGPPCHNSGKWIANLKWQRGQSYDMHRLLQKQIETNVPLSTRMMAVKDNDIDLSASVQRLMKKTVGLNAPIQDTFEYPYRFGSPVLKTIDLDFGLNNITVLRRNQLYTITHFLQKQMNIKPMLQASVIGPVVHSYGMKTWLVDDGSDRIYIQIDTMTSQAWDIRPKNWPSSVHDSTTEDIDDAIGS